jgi:hypothetical protein
VTHDPLPLWHVTLQGGALVSVWADSYSEEDRDYVFSALVDASQDEQGYPDIEITNRTPSNPDRVVVTVARFPRSAVQSIATASDSN